MKKQFTPLLLLLISLSSVGAIAQNKKDQKITLPIDSLTNLITYQGVVNVDGASKDELYVRAREWFARSFKSSKSVIQMEDKEAGKIIGKGSEPGVYYLLMSPVIYRMEYTISMTVKEGRYRYEISSFLVDGNPTEGHYPSYLKNKGPLAKKSIPQIAQIADSIIPGLKAALNKQSTGSTSKDDF